MNRYILMVLAFFVLPSTWTGAQIDIGSNANKNNEELKIIVTSLEINNKALKLSYDIKNDSDEDAWFLAETGF